MSDRADRTEKRIRHLVEGFPGWVSAYDEGVPFTGSQFRCHQRTIQRRLALGSAAAALHDAEFLADFRETLRQWRIGMRASVLVPEADFVAALRACESGIVALDGIRIDDPDLDAGETASRLWAIIRPLDIVETRPRLVACTKALHHILPDLVVPIDRRYTGAFFGWHGTEFANAQERLLTAAMTAFARIAKAVQPAQYVGAGWRTSRTKVIDNALIAYCRSGATEKCDEGAAAQAGGDVITLEWTGPFRWYGTGADAFFARPEAQLAGIYLWAVPFERGYLTYYLGETGVSFARRRVDHTTQYLSGIYRIYDPEPFARGEKVPLWGGQWLPGTRDWMAEYLNCYAEVAPRLYEMLGLFRLFLLPLDPSVGRRLRQRIEASVALALYAQPGVVGALQEPETKRSYRPRRAGEDPVRVEMKCPQTIHGLPTDLDV